jgi:hypothetical protein
MLMFLRLGGGGEGANLEDFCRHQIKAVQYRAQIIKFIMSDKMHRRFHYTIFAISFDQWRSNGMRNRFCSDPLTCQLHGLDTTLAICVFVPSLNSFSRWIKACAFKTMRSE